MNTATEKYTPPPKKKSGTSNDDLASLMGGLLVLFVIFLGVMVLDDNPKPRAVSEDPGRLPEEDGYDILGTHPGRLSVP